MLRANTVAVRLRWPEGMQRQADWQFNAFCSAGNFKETTEGIWTAELPAGTYNAQVYVRGRQANGIAMGTLLRGEAPFTVPGDPVSDNLDLAEIVLHQSP